MNVFPLAQPEISALGWTHAIEIDFSDLSDTAGTTKTIAILSVALGDVVLAAGMRLNTAFDFSDAGITSLLVELGIGGATAAIMPQKQLAVDGTEILAFVTTAATATMPMTFEAADTIDALFTVANGGSPLLSETTSGKVTIFLRIGKLLLN